MAREIAVRPELASTVKVVLADGATHAPLASQVFLPEEVWFEKLPNPFDFWRGFPPLYAAGMAAETDFAAGAFMRGVIENNADNGVLVRSENPLGDEQQEQIIAALRDFAD